MNDDRALAKDRFREVVASLTENEVEILLHGLYQMKRAKDEARYGSIELSYKDGKLIQCDTLESFRAK